MKPVFHPDIIKKYEKMIQGVEDSEEWISRMEAFYVKLRAPGLRSNLRQLLLFIFISLLITTVIYVVSRGPWYMIFLPVIWIIYVVYYNYEIGLISERMVHNSSTSGVSDLRDDIETAIHIKKKRIWYVSVAYYFFTPIIMIMIGQIFHHNETNIWILVIPAIVLSVAFTYLLFYRDKKELSLLEEEWLDIKKTYRL